MISLPKEGWRKQGAYVSENVELMCDWMEASALFLGEEISFADVVDVLNENNFYLDQGDAWNFADDVLYLMNKRSRILGEGYPIEVVDSLRVTVRGNWQDFAPYCFCLILSLLPHYREWRKAFGADYTEQGNLFEEVTVESVRLTFSGWEAVKTGWSREQAIKLKEVVNNCAAQLGEAIGDLSLWVKGTENEAGLDILCYRHFNDQRAGFPIYLFQCASGANWQEKRKTPDLEIWSKIITFQNQPKKGFSMPFSVSDQEYRISNNIINGVFLDRLRLLEPGLKSRHWISDGLKNQLVTWCDTRIAGVPLLENSI